MKGAGSTARLRKRSRMSDDVDDAPVALGGKKARGRPRVDTQDATAADRRRTQIRLAQRAYRQRKETTISSLKKQSSQLYTIVDQMNKAFLQLNDSALRLGLLQLNPELAKDFKQVAETFASCVKSASERTLDSEEEELSETALACETQSLPLPVAATQTQTLQTTITPEMEQPWSYVTIAHSTEKTRAQIGALKPQSYLSYISSSSYNLLEPDDQPSSVLRRQSVVGEALDQSRPMHVAYQPQVTEEQSQQQRQQYQQQQPLPFGLVDLPSREQSPFVPPYTFPVHIPATSPQPPSATILSTKTLAPTFTYSYQEVTFARRLMRATLEAGFMLLSSSSAHPAVLKHKFKLSLPYLTPEEIRTRFKTVLSRGVNEDLDWYATPFLHLGGAGTHYQRRDAHGKAIPLKNTWTVRQIGPLDRRIVRLESVADGQIEDLEGIDLNGFEGEWFDAYDVQGYLEEQWHCRIDPKSSFAECLVDDESAGFVENKTDTPRLSRGSTASTSVTPPMPYAFDTFEPSYSLHMSLNNTPTPNSLLAPLKQNLPDLSFDQTLGLDLAPGLDIGLAGNRGYSTLGPNMTGKTEHLTVVQQQPKKVAWVDVSKLIESEPRPPHGPRRRRLLTPDAEMIKHAVCLGRAPGYRRRDVDVAFREALIPTY